MKKGVIHVFFFRLVHKYLSRPELISGGGQHLVSFAVFQFSPYKISFVAVDAKNGFVVVIKKCVFLTAAFSGNASAPQLLRNLSIFRGFIHHLLKE